MGPFRDQLDWHPTNKFLLMSLVNFTKPDFASSIYEMNIVDSTLQLVLKAANGTVYYYAHYSPDGSKILFNSVADPYDDRFICTVNRDGSDFKKIIKAEFDSYSVWSPSGDKIAYTLQKGIYIMNADGTDNTLFLKDDPRSPIRWVGDRLLWLP